jgi:phage FluMu protein Com
MRTEGFDQTAALNAAACPRCHSVGLVEIDDDTYTATAAGNKHHAAQLLDPSIPARCTACGLVMEWPGCLPD